MDVKKITFDYNGGEYTQNLKIRGTNLPWTYECDESWISIKTGAASLTIKVGIIYDFSTRVGTIKIFDRFKNEIDLIVEQTGYYDLSVEMPSNIILYQDYYNENETYDVYLTVYGGPVQYVDCDALAPYIQKVWDNSDMYNDFILRIPQTLEGNFLVKHSDCEGFKKICEENGFTYPQDQLEKQLSIMQVTKEDIVGEMVVEYNGKQYTNYDDRFTVEVGYNKLAQVKVVSTKYLAVESKTECHMVTDSPVGVDNGIVWLDTNLKDNVLTIKCNEKNHSNDRYTQIKLKNINNPAQYIIIDIKQKSGD